MPIKNIQLGQVGLVGVNPRLIYIQTNDTELEILTLGYLNQAVENGYQFQPTDMACVITQDMSNVMQTQWYQVIHTPGNWSLQSKSSGLIGSWTPGMSFDVPGDLVTTYTVQNGQYTILGTMLFYNFNITGIMTYISSTGNFKITGLPTKSKLSTVLGTAIIDNDGSALSSQGFQLNTINVINENYLYLPTSFFGNPPEIGFVNYNNFATFSPNNIIVQGSGFYYI